MTKRKPKTKRTCDYCGADISHRRSTAKFCKDSHKVLHHQYGPKPKNRKQQQLTVDEPRPPKPRPAHGRGNDYQVASPAQQIKSLENRIKSLEEDNRILNGQLQELDKTFEIEVIMEQLDEIQAAGKPPVEVLEILDMMAEYGTAATGIPRQTVWCWRTGRNRFPAWIEEVMF